MIHTLGDVTTTVKLLYGVRAYADTKISDVVARLPIDPETSHMETLVFATNALKGISGKQLMNALMTKHPRVAIICFYNKPEELKELEELDKCQNVYIYQLSKPSDKETIKHDIEDAISKAVLAGNIDLPQSSATVISPVGEPKDIFGRDSSDNEEPASEEALVSIPVGSPFDAQRKPNSTKRIKHYEFTPGGIVNPDTARITTVNDWEIPTGLDVSAQRGFDIPSGINLASYDRPDQDMLSRVRNAANSLDIGKIDAILRNNEIARDLLNDNSEYTSAQQALNLLDQQIRTVFSDTKLTPDERMERIKTICADRSKYSAISNQIFVNKFLEVINGITQSAIECSDAIRDDYKQKFGNINLSEALFSNENDLDKLAEDRMNGQLELYEIINKLHKLYLVLDKEGDSAIADITNYAPSNNHLVNTALRPISEMFQPVNTGSLVSAILDGLENKRITFAQAEQNLNDLHEQLFKMYNLNAAVTDSQQRMLSILQAQKVEDIVVCDSIMKYKIRTIIGPDNVGRTATAVCIASAQARTDNVLLIDLSSNSKINRYVKPNCLLSEFYEAQVKDKLMIVQRSPNCIFNDFKFEESLKAAAPHYRYIYVLLSSKDLREYEIMKKLSVSVNFVTNVTFDKVAELKELTDAFNENNTARLLTLINCPENPMEVLSILNIDPIMTKLIMVPFFQEIQTAALRTRNPCDNTSVLNFFTEAYA